MKRRNTPLTETNVRLCWRVGFVVGVMILVGISSAPSSAAAPAPVSVRDFGAKGDGVTDDTAAINAAIVAAEKQGPGGTVILPAGRYRTAVGDAKWVLIEKADHLTVEGQGKVTIVSADLDQPVFRIRYSNGTTVRHLTIDYAPMSFTQGTIKAVDVAKMTCDVSIDPGYSDPDAARIVHGSIHPFVFPKQGYYQLDRYWPKPTQMEKTGDRTWRFTLTGPPNIDNWAGKRFILWGAAAGHAFDIKDLRDGTFEDIRYNGGGANAGFYINGLDGTTTFRRFNIGVPAGSGRLLSCAGGGQISDQRGALIFDDCHFTKIDDDGIDILATWTRIVSQSGPRTIIVQSRDDDYRTGDQVEVWDWLHKKSRAAAALTTFTRNSDGTFTLGLDRDVDTERTGAGTGSPFGIAAINDGLDRLIDRSMVGKQTTIRNCSFQVFRAKCLNLKAANCTVENCRFFSSFQPAISAAPEWYFEEGPTMHNLIVRGCTFLNCNHTNIDVGAGPDGGVPLNDRVAATASPENVSHDSENILIENNTFVGYASVPSVFAWAWPLGPAIHITNADHVVIRNNTFGPLSGIASKGAQKIAVESTVDSTIANNRDLSAAASQKLVAGR